MTEPADLWQNSVRHGHWEVMWWSSLATDWWWL